MRILHLVAYPLYSGPVPPTLGLAAAQRGLGHDVWVACDSKRGNFDGFEEEAAPHVRRLGLQAGWPLVLSTKATLGELWRDVGCLRRLARATQADVLHAHMSHDHWLALLAGGGRHLPLVRTVHAQRVLRRRLGSHWLARRTSGWIVRSTAHLHLLDRLLGDVGRRGRVIAAGCDAASFGPTPSQATARAHFGLQLPPGVMLLGQAALMARRGQEELVEAMALLPPPRPHVFFAGAGEAETSLRQRVARLGLAGEVHFAGYVETAALGMFYGALDAAFVAQPGNDASCRGILEAFAAALPVVGVNESAIRDLITPATGYLAAARHPEAIALALRSWLADPRREQKGRFGQEFVRRQRRFDHEAEATMDFYRAVG